MSKEIGMTLAKLTKLVKAVHQANREHTHPDYHDDVAVSLGFPELASALVAGGDEKEDLDDIDLDTFRYYLSAIRAALQLVYVRWVCEAELDADTAYLSVILDRLPSCCDCRSLTILLFDEGSSVYMHDESAKFD